MHSITWADCFAANFGKRLSQDEITAWESELKERLRSLASGEVLSAVRALAERARRGDFQSQYAPTVNHIITTIIRERVIIRAGGDVAKMTATRIEQEQGERKRRILAVTTDGERWEIICEPGQRNPDLSTELETFTRQYWPTFRRPVLPSKDLCLRIATNRSIPIKEAQAIAWAEVNPENVTSAPAIGLSAPVSKPWNPNI